MHFFMCPCLCLCLCLQAQQHANKYFSSSGGRTETETDAVPVLPHLLPRGAVPVLQPTPGPGPPRVSVRLELRVHRERVLESLLEALPEIMRQDPSSLLLPVW